MHCQSLITTIPANIRIAFRSSIAGTIQKDLVQQKMQNRTPVGRRSTIDHELQRRKTASWSSDIRRNFLVVSTIVTAVIALTRNAGLSRWYDCLAIEMDNIVNGDSSADTLIVVRVVVTCRMCNEGIIHTRTQRQGLRYRILAVRIVEVAGAKRGRQSAGGDSFEKKIQSILRNRHKEQKSSLHVSRVTPIAPHISYTIRVVTELASRA